MKSKILVLLVIISAVLTASETCKILALQGGLDNGAYQAGAIRGIFESIAAEESQWDVISGIGVGAINGAIIGSFEKGKEDEASQFLVDQWKNIKGNSDIYQNYDNYLGVFYSWFEESGLYSLKPLQEKLDNFVESNTFERDVLIGATDFDSGRFKVWHINELEKQDIADALVASVSIPGLFGNKNFKNTDYVSGGLKYTLDVPSAIDICRQKGFTQEQTVIDILLVSKVNIETVNTTYYDTIEFAIRTAEIYIFNEIMRDFTDVYLIFPDAQYRYIVAPKDMFVGYPTNYQPSVIERLIQEGINDAKAAVNSTETKSLPKVIEEYLTHNYGKKLSKKLTFKQALEYERKIREFAKKININ